MNPRVGSEAYCAANAERREIRIANFERSRVRASRRKMRSALLCHLLVIGMESRFNCTYSVTKHDVAPRL